jgi:alpha-N-arabinofuranosidase
LIGSASLRGDRALVTLVNPRLGQPLDVSITLKDGGEAREASATVLTHDNCRAHNTFDAPETIAPLANPIDARGREFTVTLAPQSVTALTLRVA